jgi:hypothetical protein
MWHYSYLKLYCLRELINKEVKVKCLACGKPLGRRCLVILNRRMLQFQETYCDWKCHGIHERKKNEHIYLLAPSLRDLQMHL